MTSPIRIGVAALILGVSLCGCGTKQAGQPVPVSRDPDAPKLAPCQWHPKTASLSFTPAACDFESPGLPRYLRS